MHTNGRTLVVAVSAVYALAIAVWAGGLVVLGAIVAPTVFRIVPAPASADAMTVVFGRFDRIAMAAAAVALVAEAILALRGGKSTRVDVARGLVVTLAGGLAITVGAWLSPGITALHRGGAVRGSGEAGLALEQLHRLAEAAGKAELMLLLVAHVLLLVRVSRAMALDAQDGEPRPTA